MVKLNKLKIVIITLCFFISILKCTGVGLVTDKYPEDFYKIPRLLPDVKTKANSTFIVYSDNQAGWRVQEKFLKKSNWTNPKMLIFPFYELYLIGNGITGAINWLRHVPDYGGKERRLVRDAIYAEAKSSQAAFILNVGDITAHDGRRPAHWEMFLKEYKIEHPLLEEIPYLPVIGNHERANDATFGLSNYQAIFDYPRFYVVEFANAVLLVVDSNFIIDQNQHIDDDLQDELFKKWFVSDVDCEESSWLEKQLAAYDKPFKIVAMHHPPIAYGKHHKDWFNQSWGRNLIKKRKQLLKLFTKYDVQVVFSGHEHIYQHNILNYATGKQIHFLVGGGGGTPLRDLPGKKKLVKFQQNFKNEDLEVHLIKQKSIYHYYIVEVNSSEIVIKVNEITGEIESPTRLIEKIEIQKL